MKQVMLSGKGAIEVHDVPVPGFVHDSVLVRNAFSLISTGTEGASVVTRTGVLGLAEKAMHSGDRLHQLWTMARTEGVATTVDLVQRKLSEYVPLGYSCSGQVVGVSPGTTGVQIGDFVACMGGDFATHSEYAVVPANLVAKIPHGVGLDQAAFGALASIAIHGVRRLELTPGETVGVLGLGLIGQITVQILAALGFTPVGIDLHPYRAAAAATLNGIEAWSLEETDSLARVHMLTNGHGLDGVVVCAASKSDAPINLAFDLCRKGGRVSLVGDVGLGLDRRKMYQKEIELRVSCSYGPGRYDPDYELAGRDYPLRYVRWTEKRNLELFLKLAKGRLNIDRLISRTFPVSEAPVAYAAVKSADPAVFGVLLSYGAPSGNVDSPSREAFRLTRSVPAAVGTRPGAEGKERVRLGIIGTGKFISSVQLPNLRELSDLYDLRAVASRSGSSAATAARKYGIGVATSDYRYLLDDSEIDAVLISTRHSSHAQIVLDALRAGKHVFVEKPMCTTIEQGEEIVELSRQTGLLVRVGFNRRFSPYLGLMKRVIGSVGKRVFSCRINVGIAQNDWSNTAEEGGRFLGEGVHFLDLCNWFFDGAHEAMHAVVAGERMNTNPNVIVQLQYPGGGAAQVLYTSLGNGAAGKEYFEAHGNGRSVVVDDYRTVSVFGDGAKPMRNHRGEKGHRAELEEFAAALLGGSYPVAGADAEAGLRATRMAIACYADVGRPE